MLKHLCFLMLICFGGLSAAPANSTPTAVLYYHPSCSHCETVKKYLSKINKTIPMKNTNNPQYQNELRRLGQKSVPTLVIGSKVVSGSTSIINYLEQHPEVLKN